MHDEPHMSGPSSPIPRILVIASGLGWSIAFVPIALHYQLELYGDGAMFSYALAVQDVWAFHWHNISGRSSVFFLTLLPAETMVGVTGRPWAGVITYGLLFYIAPMIGLILTYLADRSARRSIFLYGCCSTALLCPLVFGFPTEMWLAHAIFWPTLATSHYARRTIVGTLLVFASQLLLAFTHEGALVLLIAIVVTLVPRGFRSFQFKRGMICFGVILTLAVASKLALPPDDYYAGVLLRAALHFFDLEIFREQIVLLLLTTLAGYVVIFVVTFTISPERAWIFSTAVTLAALTAYWLQPDHSVHANGRYYLRTALVLLTPIFGAIAALSAMEEYEIAFRPLAMLRLVLNSPSQRTIGLFAGAYAAVTLIHAVETAKFVHAWTAYRNAIVVLATGQESDPSLGNPRFVSSARISSSFNSLSWFSTTPYLSVILANFAPTRLAIDPEGNYFWLSCATATQNRNAARSVPVETRELIRIYSCLHR
jgi:hypothetical protein